MSVNFLKKIKLTALGQDPNWIEECASEFYSIQLDWDNDRHHLVYIPSGASKDELIQRLRELVTIVEKDKNIK